MKDRPPPVAKATLEQIMAEFPTFDWDDRELTELVSPQYGVITGFQQLLGDVRQLIEKDLRDAAPAGPISLNRDEP